MATADVLTHGQLQEENALFKKTLKIKSLDNVAAHANRIRSANYSKIVKKMFATYKEEKRKNEDEKIARKLNKFLDQALIRTSSRS